ncbi:MAG: hypothetical protein JEZ04_17710 [Spirochaetales bacterium]|nr:hypothetical protein [Spirochaetales bacterium]
MKKRIIAFFIILATISFVGCMSTQKTKNTGEATFQLPDVVAVELDYVIGKDLVGEGDSAGIIFRFLENGIFELEKEGTVYTGIWKNTEDMPMFPYSVRWNENEDEKGYIISINEIDGQLTINGHWTITDSYITLNETFIKPY